MNHTTERASSCPSMQIGNKSYYLFVNLSAFLMCLLFARISVYFPLAEVKYTPLSLVVAFVIFVLLRIGAEASLGLFAGVFFASGYFIQREFLGPFWLNFIQVSLFSCLQFIIGFVCAHLIQKTTDWSYLYFRVQYVLRLLVILTSASVLLTLLCFSMHYQRNINLDLETIIQDMAVLFFTQLNGLLLVFTCLYSLTGLSRWVQKPAKMAKKLFWYGLLVIIGQLLFHHWEAGWTYSIQFFILLPFLIWTAFNFRLLDISLSLLFIYMSISFIDVFPSDLLHNTLNLNPNFEGMTFFVAFITSIILFLFATFKQFEDHDHHLQELKDSLEDRMLTRTQQLHDRNRYLQAIFDNMNQGICVFDENLQMKIWSARFERMIKLPHSLLKEGTFLSDIIRYNAYRGDYGSGDPEEIVEKMMQDFNNPKNMQPLQFERILKDGSVIQVLSKHISGGGVVAVYTDVSKQRKDEAMIRKLAFTDALTGLANRKLFHDRLQMSLDIAKRYKQQVALLFLDLDNFKPLNDRHGHLAGDKILREIAQRLKEVLRQVDTLARIGGDEFSIILNKIESAEDVMIVIERLLTQLSSPIIVRDKSLIVRFSIGIAMYPDDAKTFEELLSRADLALYYAKASKEKKYFFYEKRMRTDQENIRI